MPNCSRLACASALTLVCVLAGYSQAGDLPLTSTQWNSPAGAPIQAWERGVWKPLLHFFTWSFEPITPAAAADRAQVPAVKTEALVGPCSVAPLDPIEDPAALALEAGTGANGVVDVEDMIPAAARALDRFQTKVASVGGTMILKSAYRPAAYQKHLQNVWYKWMDELRNNAEPGCQILRAQVQEEFTRHRLIETQHPVAVSDHTRGLAFDATVDLPANAKIGRRKLTLDGLARLAGLLRPAIVADPVHFKFLDGVRVLRRRNG